MDTKVVWHDGLSFTATAESGFEVKLGADPEVGGKDDGFRPMELMGMSLAGCTAMDVISILKKKQQAVTAFQVNVRADRALEHPKVFTHITITFTLTGKEIQESALLRAIELSATKYCPAQAMLGKITPIEIHYEIYEEDGTLINKGSYIPH